MIPEINEEEEEDKEKPEQQGDKHVSVSEINEHLIFVEWKY